MNYYFVMDDMANKTFNFNVTYGRLDFEIQEDPFEEEWSKPIDFAYDIHSPDTIYYNFVSKKENLKKIDFGYDLYEMTHGYFLSSTLFEVLNKFNIQDSIYKKVKFTANKKIISSPDFYLLMFKYPIYDPTVVVPDVLDVEKTEQLPSKSGRIVSRKIVLKKRFILIYLN